MMKFSRNILPVTAMMIVLLIGYSCGSVRQVVVIEEEYMEEAIEEPVPEMPEIPVDGEVTTIVSARPVLTIYRTHHDYQFLVPVTLDDSKTRVMSFPDPKDLTYQGEVAIPINLEKDYLLDVRGIGLNTAFLRLTYDAYSKLEAVPTPEQLYGMILDKDPIAELYQCGYRQGREQDVIVANALIITGKINECNKLK